MKRVIKGIGACTALLFAVFIVSCGETPTEPPQVTETEQSPLFGLTVPGNGPGMCLGADAVAGAITSGLNLSGDGSDLNCTSNDVDISEAVITSYRVGDPPAGPFIPLPPGGTIDCLDGETIEAATTLLVQNNARSRYDLGAWINPDPDEADPTGDGLGAQLGTSCLQFNLVNNEGGSSILDNTPDDCGDVEAGGLLSIDLDVLSFDCKDDDGNGTVDIDACAAWHNSTTGTGEVICPLSPPKAGDPTGFRHGTGPETKAKCRCEGLNLPINIKSVLRVTKVTVPDPDPTEPDQEFGFIPTGYGAPFDLSNGETNSSGAIDAGTYSVAETVPGGWDLTDVVCVNTSDGAHAHTVTANSVEVELAQGEDVTCTFTNTKRGSITVEKQTLPDGDSQEFTFAGDLAGTIGDGGTLTTDVAPGQYTSTETILAGWALTSILCDDGNSSGNTGTGVATFNVEPGEDVKCVFTNTKDALIKVDKVTMPSGSTQSFDFTGTACGAFSLTDGSALQECPVAPNVAYSVAETLPSGWALMSATCDNDDDPSAITPDPGETVTCTFTNTQDGVIKVDKVTDPSGSTQSFDFTGTACGAFSLTDASELQVCPQPPGTYSVAETVPSGWDLTSATCDDGSDPATIGLSAGETVTCTFNNQEDAIIIVEKQTDPDGSAQLFTFSTDYSANFQLSDGQTNNSGDLDPGTYSVAETVPVGWDLTSATCDDASDPSSIGLSAGETVTCTFNNTQDGLIKVDKVTDPSGSTQSFDFTGTACGAFSLTDASALQECPQPPGTYSVAETVPSGWDLTSATCDDGSDPATIGLSAGETVTCTFNNQEDAIIIVEKQTDPDGSAQLFTFSTDYSANFQLSDGQTNNSGDLDPGTYSVAETVPFGWNLTSATCDDASDPSSIGLSAGETVTCTFNNTEIPTCEQGDRLVSVTLEVIASSGSFDIDVTDDNGNLNNASPLSPPSSVSSAVGTVFTVNPDPGPFFDSQNLRYFFDDVASKNLKTHLSCSDDPIPGVTTYSGSAGGESVTLLLVSFVTMQF